MFQSCYLGKLYISFGDYVVPKYLEKHPMKSFLINILYLTVFSHGTISAYLPPPPPHLVFQKKYCHTVSLVTGCSQLHYYELQNIIWVYIILKLLSFDCL